VDAIRASRVGTRLAGVAGNCSLVVTMHDSRLSYEEPEVLEMLEGVCEHPEADWFGLGYSSTCMARMTVSESSSKATAATLVLV